VRYSLRELVPFGSLDHRRLSDLSGVIGGSN
jgi:hypothetical protein